MRLNSTYVIRRIRLGEHGSHVECRVERLGYSSMLQHLVHHSPDGFEFGYAGSGPADLARSIVGHFMETSRPDPRIYQVVKDRLLAGAGGDAVVITSDQLQTIIKECKS